MSRWETTGFHTGDWSHSFKEYFAHYIGIGVCSNSYTLGGEAEFYHCAKYLGGMGDTVYWIQAEIDKLDELQQVKLEFILRRNKLFHEFVRVYVDKLAEIYNVETFKLYRLGTLELLNQLLIQDEFNETTIVADFVIENDIKQLSSIETYVGTKLCRAVEARRCKLRYDAGIKAHEELISLRDSFGSDSDFAKYISDDLTNS